MARTALVGRENQLHALQTFCGRADPSQASLLLSGTPGAGKTALLEAIADWATAEGYRVLSAAGVRAEAGTELCALNQLLLPLECWLPRLEPDEQGALSSALGFVDGSSPEGWAIASATSSLLRLAAADRPLLLVVDDLQWVDRSSAEVLGLLLPRLNGSGTKFIGACRTHGTGFFDRRTMPCTPVLPLDPIAAAELITRHFPGVDRTVLPRLLARSEGNPLALLELPQVLGTSRGDALPAPAATRRMSRRVSLAFHADLEQLPPETRQLLLLLALDGTGDLVACDRASTPLEVRPAERAGLVSVDPETQRLTFTNPLIALTVIGLATSDDRRTAHRELAGLLARWPERRVLHLAEAATGPDEGVAEQLEAAAALMTRRGDVEGSVTVFRRSAALSENLVERARRLAHAAYLSVAAAGDVSTGLHLLDEASRSDPAVASSLRYAMAFSAAALHGRGDGEGAHQVLVNAVVSHLGRHDGDRDALVEATEQLLDLCRWTQRPEHWSSLCAVLTELRSGGGVVLRMQVAMFLDPLGTPANAPARPDIELERILADGNPATLNRVADCAVAAGRLWLYRDRLEAVVADGRNRDGTAAAVDALCCLAQDAFLTGDWDRAQLLVDEGLAWCDRLGYPLRAWTLRWVRALVDAGRGSLAAVRQSTDEMLHWAERHGIGRVRDYAHHARALAALGSGKFDLAYQEATAIAYPDSPSYHGTETLDSALCLVEAALRTNRGDEATGLAEVLRCGSARGTSSRVSLVAAASTAMAAPEQDREVLFERALRGQSGAQYPFEFARMSLAQGQHLRRSRSATRAREHLRTALELFEHLNAAPWIEQTRIELDATGEIRNQIEPGRALTPQERTVALLAASGHTNKQIAERLFLTHRTVSAHLHQVFRKLGVDSRAALRDALDGQARDQPPPRTPSPQGVTEPHRDGRRHTLGHPISTALAPR